MKRCGVCFKALRWYNMTFLCSKDYRDENVLNVYWQKTKQEKAHTRRSTNYERGTRYNNLSG